MLRPYNQKGKNMGRLDGKVAVVTGAAAGLGRAFCLKLASEGAKIAAVTGKNAAGLNETVQLVKESGGTAIALLADISNEIDTLRMAEETASKLGAINVLVNNAAI